MKSKAGLLLAILLFLFGMEYKAQAQAQSLNIKIWSEKIPGAVKEAGYWPIPSEEERCITKISNPEMEVFLPSKEKANGTAVLIFPGGGYGVVCIHHEGYDLAKWFAERGVAGIVLKYRLPSDEIMKDKSIGSLQDAQEAMRLVRRNAQKWNIQTDKIGVMGFSAGGHLASTLSTHFNEQVYESKDKISARPDFSILIYPVISFDTAITHMGSRTNLIGQNPDAQKVRHFSNELQVNEQTPQAFLVHSADDESVPVQNSIRYFEALQKNKVQAELHIYERGGHGYGMAIDGGSESAWPEACLKWMKTKGWL